MTQTLSDADASKVSNASAQDNVSTFRLDLRILQGLKSMIIAAQYNSWTFSSSRLGNQLPMTFKSVLWRALRTIRHFVSAWDGHPDNANAGSLADLVFSDLLHLLEVHCHRCL